MKRRVLWKINYRSTLIIQYSNAFHWCRCWNTQYLIWSIYACWFLFLESKKNLQKLTSTVDYIFIYFTLHYQQLHNELLNAFTTCYTVGNSCNKLHFFHFESCVHIIFADKPTFYVIVHIRTYINLYHVANRKKWNSISIWLFMFYLNDFIDKSTKFVHLVWSEDFRTLLSNTLGKISIAKYAIRLHICNTIYIFVE